VHSLAAVLAAIILRNKSINAISQLPGNVCRPMPNFGIQFLISQLCIM